MLRTVISGTGPFGIWSDIVHFYLDGYVASKHCVIWAAENPHKFLTKALHPRKVTVWAGFTSKFILPPAFVEGKQTVNQDVYLGILRNTMLPNLPHAEQYMFMQDGATAHTANAVLDYLKTVFGNNVISRRCLHP